MQTLKYPYDGPAWPVMQQFSNTKAQQAEEIRYNNELERFFAMYPEEKKIFLANQHIEALRRTESHDIRCLTYYAPWVSDRYYFEIPVQDDRGKFYNMMMFHRKREQFLYQNFTLTDSEIINYDVFIYDFLRSQGLDRFKATYCILDWMLCDRPVMYADGTFDESDKMPVHDEWQPTFDDPDMSEQEIRDLFKVYESDYLEAVVHRVDEGVYNDYEKQLMNLLFEAYRNEIDYMDSARQASIITPDPEIQDSISRSVQSRLSGIIQRMHFVERNRRIAAQNKYIASLNEKNSVFVENTENLSVADVAAEAESISATEEIPEAVSSSVTEEIPEAEDSSVTDEAPEPEKAPVQIIAFCPRCGRKTDDNPNGRFCAGCGTLLSPQN